MGGPCQLVVGRQHWQWRGAACVEHEDGGGLRESFGGGHGEGGLQRNNSRFGKEGQIDTKCRFGTPSRAQSSFKFFSCLAREDPLVTFLIGVIVSIHCLTDVSFRLECL